jgi:hypothetical protein
MSHGCDTNHYGKCPCDYPTVEAWQQSLTEQNHRGPAPSTCPCGKSDMHPPTVRCGPPVKESSTVREEE